VWPGAAQQREEMERRRAEEADVLEPSADADEADAETETPRPASRKRRKKR
jgi:hypothetical protein